MILEGLVTTLNADGSPHLAPMGVGVVDGFSKLILRPFATATTYHNLTVHPEGVFHITDDAALIARAALGGVGVLSAMQPALRVRGHVLADACRHFEFTIVSVDSTTERVLMTAKVVATQTHREFLGFNRAKHAVIEAAIMSTRLHLIPATEVAAEFRKLQVIVGKTGGPDEHAAMTFLCDYLREMTGVGV